MNFVKTMLDITTKIQHKHSDLCYYTLDSRLQIRLEWSLFMAGNSAGNFTRSDWLQWSSRSLLRGSCWFWYVTICLWCKVNEKVWKWYWNQTFCSQFYCQARITEKAIAMKNSPTLSYKTTFMVNFVSFLGQKVLFDVLSTSK